jgi:hypothetical protein
MATQTGGSQIWRPSNTASSRIGNCGNGLRLTRVTWEQMERQRLATTARIASEIATQRSRLHKILMSV